jgi:hypothetical protein
MRRKTSARFTSRPPKSAANAFGGVGRHIAAHIFFRGMIDHFMAREALPIFL